MCSSDLEDMESAGRAVTDIIVSGLLPAALEIIDQECIKAVEASIFAAGYPIDAGAALVIEFDGTEAGLDADAEKAATCEHWPGAVLVTTLAGQVIDGDPKEIRHVTDVWTFERESGSRDPNWKLVATEAPA